MPQYIMLVNFTDQGLRGVKEVPDRQDKSRETARNSVLSVRPSG